MKIHCFSCGIGVEINDSADVPEIETHGFQIWGINEDSSYMACCSRCLLQTVEPHKPVNIPIKHLPSEPVRKPIDNGEIIIYRS